LSSTSSKNDSERMLFVSSRKASSTDSFDEIAPTPAFAQFFEAEDHGSEISEHDDQHEEDEMFEFLSQEEDSHEEEEDGHNDEDNSHHDASSETEEGDEHGHNDEEESSSGAGRSHEDATLADAIFHSLLGGSFLFITLGELIPLELEKTRTHQYPIALIMGSLMTGFTAFSLIVHFTTLLHKDIFSRCEL
jgi:hypothetical protein